MVVFGACFFSAVRICKSSGYTFSRMSRHKKCEEDGQIQNSDKSTGSRTAHSGAGWGKQFKYCYYYYGHCGGSDAQFIWMGAAGVGFMGIFLALESYRMERLAIWRNPEMYEKGYQTLQGLYAIGSGGLFGRGLGESVQKLGFLPEAQNDMIFSIICEELGLVGASFIILLFLILIWRFFVIATHAKDLLGALIATGALAHMMIQVILNIAVVTNSIPNTGITLPFISYGGTSVMFLLLEMGLVLSVSNLIE